MLQHLPAWLGHLLAEVRAGREATATADPALGIGPARLTLTSPAFGAGQRLPARFTADGEGISPPLAWSGVPAEAASLVLVVEDAGSPTPAPLVHALVYGIAPALAALAPGAIGAGAGDWRVGRNSFGAAAWLAPDPPPGHGDHDYVFQLFALDRVPALPDAAGRGAVLAAMKGRVVATGALVATYGRTG